MTASNNKAALTLDQLRELLSHAKRVDRTAYTVNEFCEAHRISRPKFYQMLNDGTGPRTMMVGAKRIVTVEAAADWRREREAATTDWVNSRVADHE